MNPSGLFCIMAHDTDWNLGKEVRLELSNMSALLFVQCLIQDTDYLKLPWTAGFQQEQNCPR